MGDRANIVIKTEGEQVCLYSHWEGSSLPDVLQAAMKRGESRWTDFQYLTRIIFCEMLTPKTLNETTGYGISQNPHDGDDRVITVDVDTQTVTIDGKVKTFGEFAAFGGEW